MPDTLSLLFPHTARLFPVVAASVTSVLSSICLVGFVCLFVLALYLDSGNTLKKRLNFISACFVCIWVQFGFSSVVIACFEKQYQLNELFHLL